MGLSKETWQGLFAVATAAATVAVGALVWSNSVSLGQALLHKDVVQLGTRVDKVEQSVDKLATSVNARIDKVETSVDKLATNVNARIDKVETSVNARIDKVETSVELLRVDVKELTRAVNAALPSPAGARRRSWW